MHIKEQVLKKESDLKNAMISGDVKSLDNLLHESLRFIIPDGTVITKEDDLENYRSGNMQVKEIFQRNMQIELTQNFAIVTVITELKASFLNRDISANYRYLRIWDIHSRDCKVLAGSCDLLNP